MFINLDSKDATSGGATERLNTETDF